MQNHCAMLEEGTLRNIYRKLGETGLVVQEEIWFLKTFLTYTSGDPFAQESETICSILVGGIMRNISVKLFGIWTSGSVGDIV